MIIYFLTLLTGLAGGAQFVLAINLMEDEISVAQYVKGEARRAALLNAADLAGAALAGIGIGVIFLPLFGFAETCCLLAILKTGTVALLGALLVFYPLRSNHAASV